MWLEVNKRVNYPIKEALTSLANEEKIDMSDNGIQYCVSMFTFRLASYGLSQFVESWNSHAISAK